MRARKRKEVGVNESCIEEKETKCVLSFVVIREERKKRKGGLDERVDGPTPRTAKEGHLLLRIVSSPHFRSKMSSREKKEDEGCWQENGRQAGRGEDEIDSLYASGDGCRNGFGVI